MDGGVRKMVEDDHAHQTQILRRKKQAMTIKVWQGLHARTRKDKEGLARISQDKPG